MSNRLHDLADVHYGKSPNEVLSEDSIIPILGTGGVYGHATRSLFSGPAVVVPRKGTLGNPQFVSEPFWPADTTYAVLPKPNVDAKWLYYGLAMFDLTKLNEATGVPSISRDWLCKVLLGSAEFSEQCRIAEILTMMDQAIEQTEALIAKTQQIKAGLMHDLFTHGVTADGLLRPTREQAPELYKESQLGWMPRERHVKRLGAVLKECGGYIQTGPFGSQLHAHEYQYEGVPVVMPQDINDGRISTDQIARIAKKRTDELARHRMKTGDIVIARRGELSRAAAIVEEQEGWICGTGCFLLRLGRSALHADFASYAYRHDLIQRQIAGMAVGTTMPSLNNTVMERLFFPLCEPVEQSLITERLSSVDRSLEIGRIQLTKFTQEKNGLMHDLLTGRVRVKGPEPEPAAASV